MITREDWAGEFGNDYTDRTFERDEQGAFDGRATFWNDLIRTYEVKSVLEVGCGMGLNLRKLKVPATGVDVNQLALDLIPEEIPTVCAEATDLPFPSDSFDLVFTFGVLIHIPAEDLEAAMREIVRVSNRLVFIAEYAGEEEVSYRGGVLWKRPYGTLYQDMGLTLVDHGVFGGEPWDTSGLVDWWLFDQRRQDA